MSESVECANSIFEQPWWLNIVAENSWRELVIEENAEVIARLPIVSYKKWYGTTVEMPKLTQTLGPWIKNREYIDGNEHLKYQKDIINKLLDKMPKCSKIIMSLDSSNSYVLPYIWRGFSIKPTFSNRISLTNDISYIYENFSKTAKKNIRIAKKKVVISRESNTSNLIELLEKTFEAQGRKNPINSDLVKKIVKVCDEFNSGIMFSALDEDGNVHACSYFVFDRNVFYYLISGSNPQFRSSGAQSLIIWEAIKYASNISETFDFEGSNIESLENFFIQFGGVPIINYEIRKIPFAFELFEMLKPKIKRLLNYKQ